MAPAEEPRERAVRLARDGKLDEAVAILEAERAKGPSSTALLADYLAILAWKNDCEKALPVYETEAAATPLPSYAVTEVARCYRLTKGYDQAIRLYRQLLTEAPQDRTLIVALATTLLEAGRLDALRQLLEPLAEEPSPPARWLSLLAVAAARQERWEDVFELSRRAASATQPMEQETIRGDLTDSFKLVQDAAARTARAGRYEESLALLRQLKDMPYRSSTVQLDEIAVNSWAERYPQAIALYEALPQTEQLPDYVAKAVAKAYGATGRHEQAALLYARALARNPQDLDARLGAFHAAVERARYEEALTHLERLAAAEPSSVEYQVWRVDLLWRLNRRDESFAALLDIPDPGESYGRVRGLIQAIPPEQLTLYWPAWRERVIDAPPQAAASVTHATLLTAMLEHHGVPMEDLELAVGRLQAGARTYPTPLQTDIARWLLQDGRIEQAEAMFLEVVKAQPDQPEARVGLARIAFQRHAYADAMSGVERVLIRQPDHLEALFLKGELFEVQEEYLKAADTYSTILSRHPDNQAALDLKVKALMSLGANDLALEVIRQTGDRVDPVLRQRALANAAMYRIRWEEATVGREAIERQLKASGVLPAADDDLEDVAHAAEPPMASSALRLEPQPNPEALAQDSALSGSTREQAILEAMNYMRDAHADFGTGAAIGASAAASIRQEQERNALRLRWDRIVALRLEKRMREVLEEYQAVNTLPVVPPPWVREAVGDAYLSLRQPKQALDIYQDVLREHPSAFQTRMAIYHTLVELGQFREAGAALDALDRDTPAQEIQNGILRENWRKAEIAFNKAWLLLYQDRLAEAEVYIRTVLQKAPFNTNIQAALAHAHLWRGWPRKALEDFEIIRTLDPTQTAAANGYCLALNATGKEREARKLNQQLLAADPTNAHLLRTKRLFEVEQMRELRTDVAVNVEHPGDEEYLVRIRGEQPLGLRGSIFTELDRRETAETGDNDVERRAYLGGTLELAPVWRLAGAVSTEYDTGNRWGTLVDVSAFPDDDWTLRARFDSHTLDIPLRSRVGGLEGSLAEGSAQYRLSESWSTIAGTSLRHLSDGNDATSLFWNTDTALTTSAAWKTRLGTELSASFNSDSEVPYYSPDHVWSLYFVPLVEHTWYRRYERALIDRLAVGLGRVWEAEFSGQTVWLARYEQDYRWSDTLGCLIGTSYAQRNYTGEDVNVWSGYSTLRVRF